MTERASQHPTRPALNRKGVSWDSRARQFTCRIGYDLRDDGPHRSFQYLTGDPEEATLKHIRLCRAWDANKVRWAELAESNELYLILPDDLAQRANRRKPCWLKEEWFKTATHDRSLDADEASAGTSVRSKTGVEIRGEGVRALAEYATIPISFWIRAAAHAIAGIAELPSLLRLS